MKANLRTYISIVISAVLLGLSVTYCVRTWLPDDAMGWLTWCAVALVGIVAVARVSLLARSLNNKEE